MKALPKNHANDGRAFEEIFKKTCAAYFQSRVLRLTKVEPPVRVLGWGPNRKVIFLENPFSDWIGTWTERGGRMLMIETKSTSEPRLRMSEDGGLSINQIEWQKRWHFAGAAVGIVWEWRTSDLGHSAVFVPIGRAWEIWKSGRRHIKFEEGDPIHQGQGFALVDFLPNLRRWYPLDDPKAEEEAEYSKFVESMVEHCRCAAGQCPCDGVLAGGLCDSVGLAPGI